MSGKTEFEAIRSQAEKTFTKRQIFGPLDVCVDFEKRTATFAKDGRYLNTSLTKNITLDDIEVSGKIFTDQLKFRKHAKK